MTNYKIRQTKKILYLSSGRKTGVRAAAEEETNQTCTVGRKKGSRKNRNKIKLVNK